MCILTSYRPSTERSWWATGSPTIGIALNSPALPIRVLNNAWLTWTNCRTISIVKAMLTRATYGAVGIEHHAGFTASSDSLHVHHLLDIGSRNRYDFPQTSEDLGERSLTDDHQCTMDLVDVLCRRLKGLRFLGEHMNGLYSLSRSRHGELGNVERQRVWFCKSKPVLKIVTEGGSRV